jgi:hypothetical protein
VDGGGGKNFLLNGGGPCAGVVACSGLERIIRMVVEVCEGVRPLPSLLYGNSKVASVASGFQKGFQLNVHLAKNNTSVERSGQWLELVTRFVASL